MADETKTLDAAREVFARAVRARIDALPIEERCDPVCKTWFVANNEVFELQRCDECWHDQPDPLDDTDLLQLPEALEALKKAYEEEEGDASCAIG